MNKLFPFVFRFSFHARLVILLTVLNFGVSGTIATHKLEPFADLVTYYQEAQLLARGQGFVQPIKINVHTDQTEPPYTTSDRFVYPISVALAIPFLGDTLATANLVAVTSYVLTGFLLYALGKQLFDTRIALCAVVLFTFNPFLHVIGVQAWTDSTVNFWYYACLLCLIYYLQPLTPNPQTTLQPPTPNYQSLFAFLTGLCLALATLTREESILLALPMLVVWWWRGHARRDALLFALGPLVGFSLRALYLQITFGNSFYVERSYFWLPRWPLWYYLGTFTPQEYLEYVGGLGGLLSIRLFNLLRLPLDFFSDGLLYDTGMGVVPLLLVVTMVAAWPLLQSQTQRRIVVLYATLCVLQVAARMGYPGWVIDSGTRHGATAAPFLLLLAAAGLWGLWQHVRWMRVLSVLLIGYYVLFAVANFGAWGQTLIQPDYRGPVVLAAEWARDHLPATALLMTRHAAETHYFSSRYVVVTPSGSFADMMAFARAHHVTHFFITDDDRKGAPNLLQGLRAFPKNFLTVYSTNGAQIVAIVDDHFPLPLILPNEVYASKTTGRPEKLVDWGRLQPSGTGTVFETLTSSWRDVLNALLYPTPAPKRLAQTVNVRADNGSELVRYDLANTALARDDEVQLTLHWRALAPSSANYTVFVHLLDAAGQLRAQKDAQPLNGVRPTSAWQPGEWLEDQYSFLVPADAPTGAYTLAVGLYDGVTGKRLPLRDATGQPLADDRLLIEGLTIR